MEDLEETNPVLEEAAKIGTYLIREYSLEQAKLIATVYSSEVLKHALYDHSAVRAQTEGLKRKELEEIVNSIDVLPKYMG